jgi:hypothetical protein
MSERPRRSGPRSKATPAKATPAKASARIRTAAPAPDIEEQPDGGTASARENRESHVVVRVTPAQKRQIEEAAKAVHLRVSDWVRQVVLTALGPKQRE